MNLKNYFIGEIKPETAPIPYRNNVIWEDTANYFAMFELQFHIGIM